MKLSGTTALYTQLKELENAVAVTKRQIALAEEMLEDKPAKKTRAKREKTKAGVIKANGLEERGMGWPREDHAS